ncbi:MAG: hypothetical protein JXP36_16470, partial [Bacteroidales bacterium]|nr:hypothetical protein [Bacteroidales bacterium]
GWWKNSPDNSWATLHVLEALARAKQMGYSLKLDNDNLAGKITWDLENTTDISTRIRLMKMARIMGVTIDYKRFVAFMEAGKQISSFEMVQLMELRQLFGMACNTDTLKHFRRETLFGNVFYSFPAGSNSLVNNDVQSTLMVYNILKNDSVTSHDALQKMRNYLFEQRKSGCWRNTWESARVIETILPDVLTGKRSVVKPELRLSGDIEKKVATFPFEMELEPGQNISVEKTGDAPVYLTTWQRYWNPEPQVRRNDFEITTRFQNEPDGRLTGGKITKLIVTVKINKAAEFVMINIPIPAGCSYANKEMSRYNEAHREYYRNEVAIFCERLSVGEHTFEVELLPRYPGKYTLNPARVELMYFPTFYSNNGLKSARIK